MRNRLVVVGFSAVLGLGLVACGDDDDTASTTDETVEMEEHSETDFAFGAPGDPANATRVVDVKMLDTLRFDPSSIAVAPGETVTFKVTNTSGSLIHEFIIGDQKFQDEHEKEMAEMAKGQNVSMADEPYGVNIRPGQTEEITWTFPAQPGETIYFACHEPGHFNTMKGEFTATTTGGGPATTAGGPATTAASPTTMGDMPMPG